MLHSGDHSETDPEAPAGVGGQRARQELVGSWQDWAGAGAAEWDPGSCWASKSRVLPDQRRGNWPQSEAVGPRSQGPQEGHGQQQCQWLGYLWVSHLCDLLIPLWHIQVDPHSHWRTGGGIRLWSTGEGHGSPRGTLSDHQVSIETPSSTRCYCRSPEPPGFDLSALIFSCLAPCWFQESSGQVANVWVETALPGGGCKRD